MQSSIINKIIIGKKSKLLATGTLLILNDIWRENEQL